MMPDFDELRGKLSCLRIAHHIRGRIRLKLVANPTAVTLPGQPARQFQTILDSIPGLLSVRINLLALSCAVEYDPTLIPEQAWSDFLTGADSPDAAILEQILRDTYQEIMHAKL